MCGIVGAIASRNVVPILTEGLKRLEYRGYDSAGIAVLNGGIKRVRRVEFADLPKTISGKIRRTELRAAEESRSTERRALEFWEEDLR